MCIKKLLLNIKIFCLFWCEGIHDADNDKLIGFMWKTCYVFESLFQLLYLELFVFYWQVASNEKVIIVLIYDLNSIGNEPRV